MLAACWQLARRPSGRRPGWRWRGRRGGAGRRGSGVFSIILDSHVRRNAAVFPIEAVRVPKSRKILRKPRNFKQGPPRRVCTDRRQHNHVHQSVRADHCLGPRAA